MYGKEALNFYTLKNIYHYIGRDAEQDSVFDMTLKLEWNGNNTSRSPILLIVSFKLSLGVTESFSALARGLLNDDDDVSIKTITISEDSLLFSIGKSDNGSTVLHTIQEREE